jgi:hypothetical protein
MGDPQMRIERSIFRQEKDCCDSDTDRDQPQELIVQEENGGIDVDADAFWIIKTDRFAFDCIEDFVAILRRAGVREKLEGERGPPPDGKRETTI